MLRLLSPSELKTRAVPSNRYPTGDHLHPNRAKYDFYPTPPEATRALLNVESFEGSIWEPACGQGHISKELIQFGYEVHSTDLIARGFGTGGRDFLKSREPEAKNIITNPPYGKGLADAFLRHALNLTRKTGGKVAFLSAVQSLCHPLRHDLYVSHPPKEIYALDDCTCWPNGIPQSPKSHIAKQRYCWMVWEPSYVGTTSFRWLTTRIFK